MITPKQYSKLADAAYKVDIQKQYNPVRETANKSRSVITTASQNFKVIKTVDTNDKTNSKGYADNGFQAMAVAPVVNGHVDRSQTIIAYAGTNAQDPSTHDLRADFYNVVVGEKGKDTQFASATQFYQAVSKMKDVKVVSATGHSLGGALAQKIAAKYHIPAVTFSTAGVGKQLTGEEKQWLRGPGKNLVLNYMHLGDQIPSSTNAKEFGTALYAIDFSDGSLFSGHQLGSYQFYNSGNLFVEPSVASEYSNIITTQGLDNLKKVMKKFEKSGGALTTGQKQFLDEYEALTLVTGMQVLVASELKSLEMAYEKSINEAQELWSNADAAARLIGIDLAEYERLSILDSGGVSRTTIETKPTTKYHKKIAKVKAVIKDYTDLTSKITAAIRHQAETDQALAAQIKGWL